MVQQYGMKPIMPMERQSLILLVFHLFSFVTTMKAAFSYHTLLFPTDDKTNIASSALKLVDLLMAAGL